MKVLIVFLALLTLGGCTSEPREITLPSAESTYTIPPRPQLTAPTPPEITNDVAGARELARFYVELYPYVKATGDTALWQEFAHPECSYCQTVLDAAKSDSESGAWGDIQLEFKDEVSFKVDGNADFRVDFLVYRPSARYYDSDSAQDTPASEHAVVIGLKSHDGKLKIWSFQILDPTAFGSEE